VQPSPKSDVKKIGKFFWGESSQSCEAVLSFENPQKKTKNKITAIIFWVLNFNQEETGRDERHAYHANPNHKHFPVNIRNLRISFDPLIYKYIDPSMFLILNNLAYLWTVSAAQTIQFSFVKLFTKRNALNPIAFYQL
jgi:hypothetical protein